jgi:FSR family fosmidomycin resistance protein-like MFS transporter
MPTQLLRLVLLVSCAHALVHMYELSLPGVEQKIASEFSPGDVMRGKEVSGMLSMTWRLPWGIGALFAGLLVDRFGAKRLLLVYLFGVSLVCVLVGFTQSLSTLFGAMFGMGLLASIYHPAGLTWISHRTNEQQRPLALGVHGIFGSLGIASGPLLAAIFTSTTFGFTWREFYFALAIPGVLLATFLAVFRDRAVGDRAVGDRAVGDRAVGASREKTGGDQNAGRPKPERPKPEEGGEAAKASENRKQDESDWKAFSVLTTVAICQGIVYSGVLSFLPRYMSGWDQSNTGRGSTLATGVLILGCIGQYIAGYFARPGMLERQLCWITLSNAPLLLWMAVADGPQRILAAGAFSIVHFMHQPIYNSLIATYSPRANRSFAYGISIALGLGLGSCGALLVGFAHRQLWAFSCLAGVAVIGGTIAAQLARMRRG